MRARLTLSILAALAAASAGCSSSSSQSSAGGGNTSEARSSASSAAGQNSTSASSAAASGSGGNSPPSAIHFIGRFDTSSPAGPSFGWPGSSILTRFSGTGIDIKLKDSGNNQFDVVIDGAPPKLLKTNSANDSYPLVTGLPDAPHDVTIRKRTESFVGTVQFLGFASAGGQPLIETPEPFQRRIEFIGDSITCGYGDEGPDQNCHFSPDTENASLAYGALTAKGLNAAYVAIAYSGIGAYRNNDGATKDVMGVRYERTLADDPASKWSFSAFTADVVVINLSTNDFAKGDPGQPFADAYLSLVKQVRGHYPSAYIFCSLGPMLSDSFPAGEMALTKARGYISGVVDKVRAAGDARVNFVEFPTQDAANGLGCDYHPSLKTHQLMADKLKAAIQAVTGW
jgi:lysophospholipase L1-like esterase